MTVHLKGYGQDNGDTIRIPSVTITADRISDFAVGVSVIKIDSVKMLEYQGGNLASLLQYNSTVSIKDYGAGGIATTSSRGTAAKHTGVIWNGFLINSPNLGLCDLSLIPATIANEINIYSGGSSAVNGHSALGGLISLASKPAFHKYTNISFSGSYTDAGNYASELNGTFATQKISSSTQLFYANNKNNFLFINKAKKGFPEELVSHARVINYGLVQQLSFKIKDNQVLEGGAWYQFTDREQPPLMTSYINEATLTDSIFRAYLAWHKTGDKISWSAKAAWFNESEKYNDPAKGIHSTYIVKSYKAEINGRFNILPELQAESGVTLNVSNAEITEYKESVTDTRYSIYGGILYTPLSSLKIRGNIRQEITTGLNPPVTPSFGMEYMKWNNLLVIKVTAGKQYNLPCLNDKYWQPGGNLNLQPEIAWSGDAGVILSPDKKRNLKWSATVFQMLVDNWIQWAPIDSTGLYKAANLKKVNSSGIETGLSYSVKIKKIQFNFSGCLAYTRSIIKSSEAVGGEASEGKQLNYVPLYNSSVNAGINYMGFTLSYQHAFMGKRYTRVDNSDFLPAYNTGSIYAAKNILLKEYGILLFVKVINPWNEQYQVVKWHAMPLRYICVGFKLNYYHKKNQT